MGWESELVLSTTATREAGTHLKDLFGKEQEILHIDEHDIKLAADLQAEKIILKTLDESGQPVLAEESGVAISWALRMIWRITYTSTTTSLPLPEEVPPSSHGNAQDPQKTTPCR